ncbi:MAG: uncharacterized protein QOH90_602 [Actinomycetota bacterium]|nr:uncharacterized protein [Actinomycetota bacterium]
MQATALSILCDGRRLSGGAEVPDDPKGLVLLLHGLPSISPPAADDMGYPGLAKTFADAGWIGAWVDMRGVRGSKGDFSIQGWVRDAQAALDAARTIEGAGSLPVAVVGSSAGGAVATELVRRGARVDALVLLAAPAEWISFAGKPEEGLRRVTEDAGLTVAPESIEDPAAWAAEFDEVSTARSISGVTVPTLILHGTADDVVPVDHATRIADRSRHAETRIIEGAGHQLRRDPEAVSFVFDWLERNLPK